MNSLADHLDGLASKGVIERDDFDVEHSGDVLTVNTGIRNMKYVINRQVGKFFPHHTSSLQLLFSMMQKPLRKSYI